MSAKKIGHLSWRVCQMLNSTIGSFQVSNFSLVLGAASQKHVIATLRGRARILRLSNSPEHNTTMSGFSSLTVDQLQNFLKQRGVSYSGYPKVKLIQLCEAAKELQVPKKEENDFKTKNCERLCVPGRSGTKVQLAEPSEVQNWTESLQPLPDIDLGDIFAYLMTSGWSSDKLKTYKSSHGYLMFIDKHVACVQTCSRNVQGMEDVVLYVKAKVNRETSINTVYSVWAILSGNGSVFTGGCECPGDDGSCKHVIALLFALQDWSKRHQDRHTEVGTDVTCKWDHARVSSKPKILEDIKIHHTPTAKLTPVHENFTPQDVIPLLNEEQVKQKIFDIVAGSSCQLTEVFESSVKVYPPTLKELFKGYNTDEGKWLDHLKKTFNKDQAEEIELITRGQAKNPKWLNYRVGRVTASIAHEIVHHRTSSGAKSYVQRILGQNKKLSTKAIEFGKRYEPVARRLYLQLQSQKHKNVIVTDCGLFIPDSMPHLGASPDGIVQCECCNEGILEIKCTLKHMYSSNEQIARDKKYHFNINSEGKLHLKHNSKWHFQIQHQLLVTNKNWCDLVLFIKGNKGSEKLSIERIFPNQTVKDSIAERSGQFFENFILPQLCVASNVKEGN